MIITVNGEKKEVAEVLNIKDLLDLLEVDADTVVVERNRDIYSSGEYSDVRLQANDEVEIVRFMGGG
ncbi:sulfur carrier protein ThiS [bacterium]|nr:sulfur carrier protein ThiS [bacterium]